MSYKISHEALKKNIRRLVTGKIDRVCCFLAEYFFSLTLDKEVLESPTLIIKSIYYKYYIIYQHYHAVYWWVWLTLELWHWERPWHRTPTWRGQSQSEPWSRPPETTNQNHCHIYFIQSEFSITGPTTNRFLFFISECRNPVLNFKTSTNI